MLTVWLMILLIVSSIAPLGLFGRDCLHEDHSIDSYNIFNHVSGREYTAEDYRHLTLRTKYVTGYRIASRWTFEMKIEMTDGRSFTFDFRDFDYLKAGYHDNCLNAMSRIKELFSPGDITVVGAEDTDKVAEFIGFSEAQTLELQKLFTV